MNGFIEQYGSQNDTGIPMAEKTKTFDIPFINRPVVNINTTGVTDNANDAVVVSWGNVYYGIITQINTSNFKYRGNKIVWQAFGF